MAYDFNAAQQQLNDLSRQYQALTSQQLFQPMMPTNQQVPIPVPAHQIQYVEGLNGAKLYQDNMQYNSSEIIMDKDEDIFYKVSKDANGIPSRHIIRCRFSVEELEAEEPAFLTKKDLDDFKEEIRQMLNASSQEIGQPKSNQSSIKKTQGDAIK